MCYCHVYVWIYLYHSAFVWTLLCEPSWVVKLGLLVLSRKHLRTAVWNALEVCGISKECCILETDLSASHSAKQCTARPPHSAPKRGTMVVETCFVFHAFLQKGRFCFQPQAKPYNGSLRTLGQWKCQLLSSWPSCRRPLLPVTAQLRRPTVFELFQNSECCVSLAGLDNWVESRLFFHSCLDEKLMQHQKYFCSKVSNQRNRAIVCPQICKQRSGWARRAGQDETPTGFSMQDTSFTRVLQSIEGNSPGHFLEAQE